MQYVVLTFLVKYGTSMFHKSLHSDSIFSHLFGSRAVNQHLLLTFDSFCSMAEEDLAGVLLACVNLKTCTT